MRKYLVNPPRVRVEVDGKTTEGVTVVVQNSDPFTYFRGRAIRVCEGASLDNGTLSLSVLERASAADMPTLIPRLFSAKARTVQRHRQIVGFQGIDYARVVATEGTFPLQVDGDFIGEFEEASYSVVPNALSVVA
jgi:diacylglycerol kinase family enzyme